MFIDLGETRRDGSTAGVRGALDGRGTNIALGLLASAIAAVSIVGWRAVDVLEKTRSAEQRENQEFNEGLVQAIEKLSENAGLMTSAELCPVKFRLRTSRDQRSTPPARPFTAELREIGEDGDASLRTSTCSNIAGLLDFGLQEPGHYRLKLTSPDGMTMQHDFEVLPGVPVDRLAHCPLGAPNGSNSSIAIDWPEELNRSRLAAICRVRPCSYELDGWIWSPKPDQQDEYFWSQNCRLAAADADVTDMVAHGSIPYLGATQAWAPMYCRYWELAEITFVRLRDSGSSSGSCILGRAGFGDRPALSGEADSDLDGSCPIWLADCPPPRWDAIQQSEWTLTLSPEIVERLRWSIEPAEGMVEHDVDESSGRAETGVALPAAPATSERFRRDFGHRQFPDRQTADAWVWYGAEQ